MALPADAQTRTIPSAWTPLDPAHSMQEALEALESYKKKDPSKGICSLKASKLLPLTDIICSGREVQSGGQCPDHEAEPLQDHSLE